MRQRDEIFNWITLDGCRCTKQTLHIVFVSLDSMFAIELLLVHLFVFLQTWPLHCRSQSVTVSDLRFYTKPKTQIRGDLSDNQHCCFAISDIEAALRWVNSNIAAFGGDPTRVWLSDRKYVVTWHSVTIISAAPTRGFYPARGLSGKLISLNSRAMATKGFLALKLRGKVDRLQHWSHLSQILNSIHGSSEYRLKQGTRCSLWTGKVDMLQHWSHLSQILNSIHGSSEYRLNQGTEREVWRGKVDILQHWSHLSQILNSINGSSEYRLNQGTSDQTTEETLLNNTCNTLQWNKCLLVTTLVLCGPYYVVSY
ncbi:hypothetical protein J6590_099231 [Homalodisca vitripennis]|nr:hypothetical protein J6590_099231 [Homalodisca vitripennis]